MAIHRGGAIDPGPYGAPALPLSGVRVYCSGAGHCLPLYMRPGPNCPDMIRPGIAPNCPGDNSRALPPIDEPDPIPGPVVNWPGGPPKKTQKRGLKNRRFYAFLILAFLFIFELYWRHAGAIPRRPFLGVEIMSSEFTTAEKLFLLLPVLFLGFVPVGFAFGIGAALVYFATLSAVLLGVGIVWAIRATGGAQ